MSGASKLANAAINLTTLRDHARRELNNTVLDAVRGKKAIILDAQLSGPLGLMVETSMLKEHGVEKMFRLDTIAPETDIRNIIYMIRPNIDLVKMVAEHIHQYKRQKKVDSHQYHLFFVPRRTMICERVLEEEGVFGNLILGEYHLDLVPFDNDVLSLELPTSFRELYLDGDYSALFYVARSLMKLQAITGIIPTIKGKGECSKKIMELLLRMRKEQLVDDPAIRPEISQIILIDRNVDLVSALLTQLTYEGLIDEMLGIKDGLVELDTEIITGSKPTAQQPKQAKHPLNSNDQLYREVRDLHFGVLGPLLNQKARMIDENYKERHGAKTVSQIRDFMKKLNVLQREHHSLRIHTNIAERIMTLTKESGFHQKIQAENDISTGSDLGLPFIEECIFRKEPLVNVLRLLCLVSVCNNGLRGKSFDALRRQILQSYGYSHIFTLNNLERAGLLCRSTSRTDTYGSVRKNFRLEVPDLDDSKPQDFAYVYSGFAPLSVRLVQHALQPGGWRALEDTLKLLPGPSFEATQDLPVAVKENILATEAEAGSSGGPPPREIILVFFVGGVTFAEISALRWLSMQSDGQREFVIATTKMINGTTMLNGLVEDKQPIALE